MQVATKGFIPQVAHLDRPLRAKRQDAGMGMHGKVLTPTERAANAGQVNPDLLARKSKQGASCTWSW